MADEAAALVPEAIKKDGKLTFAVSPFAPPLAVYATDNKTPVGNEGVHPAALGRGEQSQGAEAGRVHYDDDSASNLALQSGRADLTFGPNATAAYKAATDEKTKLGAWWAWWTAGGR